MEFSVISLIGALSPLVCKNAIMMIDFRSPEPNIEREGAARCHHHEACLPGFHPIMMTTMAALLSALPLALGTGVGSELQQASRHYRRWRTDIVTSATLYTTPVVYLLSIGWPTGSFQIGNSFRVSPTTSLRRRNFLNQFLRSRLSVGPVATALITIAFSFTGAVALPLRFLPVAPLRVDFPVLLARVCPVPVRKRWLRRLPLHSNASSARCKRYANDLFQ